MSITLAAPLLLAAAPPVQETIANHFPPETVALFAVAFVFSLVMDLVQHKDGGEVTVKNAAGWSLFWVALSLGFAGWLRFHHGEDHPEWASLFLAGYVLEKTLSVDNLMVFIAIFRFFHIKSGLQHRILYFGILGAIIFRAIFVSLGAGLLALPIVGPFVEIVFGAFIVWSAVMMLRGGDEDGDGEPDYEDIALVRVFKKFFPVFPRLVGSRFFVGRAEAEPAAQAAGIKLDAGVSRWMTPAFICLLVIEGSDVMFSFDSVPAVIAVTKEPLVVYTAMIFAVLGLRSLYFIVEALVNRLQHLEKAVVGILFFIGIKMFVGAAAHWGVKLPWWGDLSTPEQANYSLVVVLSALVVGVLASKPWQPPVEEPEDKTAGEPT